MTRVHYFQRYSQPENVDTNNTLLLLTRIQAEEPRLLREVLAALLSDLEVEVEIGAQFAQQTRSGESIPDGTICQSSFRFIIETKRTPDFSPEQLTKHLSAFRSEALKLLILLTPERPIVRLPDAAAQGVHVIARSFSDIVNACRSASLYNHPALREIVEDYEDYCHESNLISRESERLLVVPVGTTLDDNINRRLYYAPARRTFQKYRFLGLYARKSVRALGELENIISADIVSGKLVVQKNEHSVEADQRHRIQQAIDDAPKHGYDISSGHSFFLVKEFFETDFKKSSSGGLFGKRYFDLREELEVPRGTELPGPPDIATTLKQSSWD